MSDGRCAAFLVLVAFLARFVTFLGTLIFGTDGGQFLFMADRMREARFHEALSVTYHPLYPLLAAASGTLLGSTEQAGFWVSMVLGSGAVLPLFSLARAVFGRPAAFLTGLLFAFHPFTVDLHADVMTEATFTFFLFWAMGLAWKALEQPSLESAVLASLSAAAAFLTRAEGLAAMVLVPAWQIVELLRRRDRWAVRLGGVGAGLAAMGLLVFPFLVWVRSVHPEKKWALSAKQSVSRASSLSAPAEDMPEDAPAKRRGIMANRYARLAVSAARQLYVVGIPFFLLGCWSLRGFAERGILFYFSFPLLHLGGLMWGLRNVPYMSYRYVVPPMNLLSVVTALGLLETVRFLARRAPGRRGILAAQVLVLVVAVAPGVRAFGIHRAEENVAREAAAWIRAQGGPGRGVCSTLDQVGYLSGTRNLWFAPTYEMFREDLDRGRADFLVYTDRDLASGRPAYLDRLRECDRLEPPVEIPGRRIVYLQRVRR